MLRIWCIWRCNTNWVRKRCFLTLAGVFGLNLIDFFILNKEIHIKILHRNYPCNEFRGPDPQDRDGWVCVFLYFLVRKNIKEYKTKQHSPFYEVAYLPGYQLQPPCIFWCGVCWNTLELWNAQIVLKVTVSSWLSCNCSWHQKAHRRWLRLLSWGDLFIFNRRGGCDRWTDFRCHCGGSSCLCVTERSRTLELWTLSQFCIDKFIRNECCGLITVLYFKLHLPSAPWLPRNKLLIFFCAGTAGCLSVRAGCKGDASWSYC